MEHHVKTHPLVAEMLLKLQGENHPRILANIRTTPAQSLGFEAERARLGLATVIHLREPHHVVLGHLDFAQQVAAVVFEYEMEQTPFRRWIWDAETEFSARGQQVDSYLIYPKWKYAFDLAVACRNLQDINILVNVPETMMTAPMSSTPGFDMAAFRFYRHFFDGGAATGERLIAAFEEMLRPSDNPVRTGYLEAIAWPELKIYEAFLRRDQERLDAAFVKAVRCHHAYFGHKSRKGDALGWISTGMMAAASIIRDNSDLKVAENPYIYAPIIDAGL